ncbi:MAG: hypothetical protein KIT80_09140 [Chitinophagaceae bacterium]|nr:hypothetical protein [Chitinophagaceae bacterium]MCW5927062.1 hypothetical protein [Chitinophagaceae bacterium]
MNPRAKKSYHPFVMVAFYLQFLPEEILAAIPRSTRHEWQHKPVTVLFGYDWYCQNRHLFQTLQEIAVSRKLQKINKALLRIIAIQRFVHKYKLLMQSRLSGVNEVVLSNIAKAGKQIGFNFCLKLLRVSRQQYRQLKQRICSHSPLSLCIPKHPAQLLHREVSTIKKYCEDSRYIHWPLASVYHQIIRDRAAFFHINTFYKYVTRLNLTRRTAPKRRKNHSSGIRAAAPLQLLHADVTVFRTVDNMKSYIYLVQDNFSRAILDFAVSSSCKATVMMKLVQNTHTTYLQPAALDLCRLMTDDGSENFGPVKNFLANTNNPVFEHIIAQRDVEFSNSMIEAANKNLKYHFLYHKHIADFNSLCHWLPEAISDFNNRPHNILNGLTPLEVLNGKTADKISLITQRQTAKIERIAKNKQQKCCNYSF